MENGLLTNNLNKNQKEIINLKNLLSKYSLNNSIDLLNKNYGAFEIKQKNEEPNKEEN